MELGIFIQGYLPPSRRLSTPDAEHWVLMRELEIAVAADRAGIKYIWASEHHFLDEYSHLSANDVVLGYLAHATERAHIGSGIFNPLPQVNHPAKVAERVAMLDHLSGNRFEFGTGRGAGSHEILGFLHRDGITDTTLRSGLFYASAASAVTGPVVDQAGIFPDLRNATFQDNANQAIHRFIAA